MGMSIEEAFGDFRSLVSRHRGSSLEEIEAWSKDVVEVLMSAYAIDPIRYGSEWIEYVMEQADAFPIPLYATSSLDELALLCSVIPGARFDLNLNRDRGADDTANIISTSHDSSSLHSIDMNFSYLTVTGLEQMLSSMCLGSLVSLDVSQARIELRQKKMFPALNRLKALKCLEIGSNKISVDGLLSLFSRSSVASLKFLGISSVDMDSNGFVTLVDVLRSSDIEGLDVGGNEIEDEGVAYLAESQDVPSLSSLDLSGCRVTESGVAALANSHVISGMEHLFLNFNSFGACGLNELMASTNSSSLKTLSMTRSNIEGARISKGHTCPVKRKGQQDQRVG